jgi:hypothetical protein
MAGFQRKGWGNKTNTNGTSGEWTLDVKMGKYSENNELMLKLTGLKNEDIKTLASNIFTIKQEDKTIWICVAEDKIDDFKNSLDQLETVLKNTKNYTEKSIISTIDKIEDFIESTPNAADEETNNRNIATNWRELLQSLQNPDVRKKFLIFQTTYTCSNEFSDAKLSPANIASVLAADPQASFVTNAHTWRDTFKRYVQPGAPFIIITKAESSLPMHILKDDPEVMKAGGWNAFVKASGGINSLPVWAARKRAMNNPKWHPSFYKQKVYDVRFTTPIDPNNDPFMTVANMVNNLTGEINQAAKDILQKTDIENGVTDKDYDAKREGLETNEQLNAFRDFILKKCKMKKIQVSETGNVHEVIANAVYAYAYEIAAEYNKLSPKARQAFASAVCYAIAHAFNIQASRVNSAINVFERLRPEEAEIIVTDTFPLFKTLSNFTLKEDAGFGMNDISFEDYSNMLMGLVKNKNKRAYQTVKENFTNLLDRMNNIPR